MKLQWRYHCNNLASTIVQFIAMTKHEIIIYYNEHIVAINWFDLFCQLFSIYSNKIHELSDGGIQVPISKDVFQLIELIDGGVNYFTKNLKKKLQ